MVEIFSCLSLAARLRESSFDSLEKAYVVADRDCFFCAGAECERLRQFGDDLNEAVFAILLLQDVFLCAGSEGHLFRWCSGPPLRPVEAVHHATRDFVFLLHDGDCFRGVDARTTFASTLCVSRERVLQLIGETEVINY